MEQFRIHINQEHTPILNKRSSLLGVKHDKCQSCMVQLICVLNMFINMCYTGVPALSLVNIKIVLMSCLSMFNTTNARFFLMRFLAYIIYNTNIICNF